MEIKTDVTAPMRLSSFILIALSALAILAAPSTSGICDGDGRALSGGLLASGTGPAPAEVEALPSPQIGARDDGKTSLGCGLSDEGGSMGIEGSMDEEGSEPVLDPHSLRRMMDITGISALHAWNITGRGVTIALLDSQFYYDPETAGKLTSEIVPLYDESYGKDEVHGIACAELISLIAPGVKIYLVDVGITEEGVARAVERLLELEERIDIVSCSSDFPFGRFDGEDPVCQEVVKMTSNGTLWINAAGNEALRHWSGEFKDPDGNGFLNFSPEDESINLTLKRGDDVSIWLSWKDDWEAAALDYDLRLDHPGRGRSVSDNPQRGYRGQKPVETIRLVAPRDGTYQIKIRSYDGADHPGRLHLFTTSDLDEHQVPNTSIGILGCCRNVVTVGAINISTLEIQPYSSRGPTEDGRQKPDLVAPDNVTTSSYATEGFVGTSAAAPFVAGCAALVLEIFKDDPDLDVRRVLLESSTDLGPPGPDEIYGWGLVNLSNLEVNI